MSKVKVNKKLKQVQDRIYVIRTKLIKLTTEIENLETFVVDNMFEEE